MKSWPALDIQHGDQATGELIQAFLTDFALVSLAPDTPSRSCAFFQDTASRDRAAAAVSAAFPRAQVRTLDIPDFDWAARSQANLRAIRIGGLVVAPPWDVPDTPDGLVVVIQPSMGFGTGHHATTRLCLDALQRTDLRGQRVVDLGTGSGVLAIAASLLGAGTVTAIDEDPDAIASARENLTLNPDAHVTCLVQDVRRVAGSFDLVLANLTGGLLIAIAAHVRGLASASSRLILSGLLVEEADAVIDAYAGFSVARRTREDEWVSLELTPGGQQR